MKAKAGSVTLTALFPRSLNVVVVAWSQSVIPMAGTPANPVPLELSNARFEDGGWRVTVGGGEPGTRYLVRTSPGDFRGDSVPLWVREFRVEVA